MNRSVTLTLILLLLAALAACAPASPTEEAPTPLSRPTAAVETPDLETVPTIPPQEAMPVLPIESDAVQSAVADLSTRLEVPAEEIAVVRAEPVTWSDGSLGCPQPDMMYTQALVEGVWIQLRVADTLYSYHGGGSQAPVLCESAAPVAPGELPPGAFGSST